MLGFVSARSSVVVAVYQATAFKLMVTFHTTLQLSLDKKHAALSEQCDLFRQRAAAQGICLFSSNAAGTTLSSLCQTATA